MEVARRWELADVGSSMLVDANATVVDVQGKMLIVLGVMRGTCAVRQATSIFRPTKAANPFLIPPVVLPLPLRFLAC